MSYFYGLIIYISSRMLFLILSGFLLVLVNRPSNQNEELFQRGMMFNSFLSETTSLVLSSLIVFNFIKHLSIESQPLYLLFPLYILEVVNCIDRVRTVASGTRIGSLWGTLLGVIIFIISYFLLLK